VVLALALPAFPRAHKSEGWARNQFSAAERMREALNGRPADERTRRAYHRVISAYRSVYYGAPTSTKADPSVVAVAELMVEEGRHFQDDGILRAAIGQYQFLRREYPGSKYRFDALFTVGEIYKDDLDDSTKARSAFQEFLKRYPRHHLAEDARSALAEQAQEARHKKAAPKEEEDASENDSDSADTQVQADAKPHSLPRVTGIRHWSTPDYTRVAIDLEQDVKFDSQRIADPDRIFFDLRNTRLASTLVGKSFDVDDGFLKKIRVAQFQPDRSRVVLEVDDLSAYEAFLLSNPSRLIIDIHGKKSAKVVQQDRSDTDNPAQADADPGDSADNEPEVVTRKIAPAENQKSQPADAKSEVAANTTPRPAVKKKIVEPDDDDAAPVQAAKLDPEATSAEPRRVDSNPKNTESPSVPSRSKGKRKSAPAPYVREAQPTANGDRSLIRALGLKIGKIVIDPGHGGHDTGTIGPNGLQEKDLVLEVGRRLGKLLETRLGAEVVFTRSDDTFIPLETRTAIANQEQADLFVSIHANSSGDPDARGVETYYLNFTSSPEALEVAARENAVSEKSIHELQDLVKKIALKEKIDESREFASDVQQSLHTGLAAKSPAIRDRGVKKAPFIVLIGANMPSILAEISFVSNPTDERKLQTAEYRQRIAESLYQGISKYAGGLSGVKVASRIARSEAQ
jgi:N-acetylmuramoyl-L-alanine amidase